MPISPHYYQPPSVQKPSKHLSSPYFPTIHLLHIPCSFPITSSPPYNANRPLEILHTLPKAFFVFPNQLTAPTPTYSVFLPPFPSIGTASDTPRICTRFQPLGYPFSYPQFQGTDSIGPEGTNLPEFDNMGSWTKGGPLIRPVRC